MTIIGDAMERLLPQIEEALQQALATPEPALDAHYGMMHYHLGWTDQTFQAVLKGGGKRLRPLLCILAGEAAGCDVELLLLAAAAIEVLHSFSLVHDDIEDNSPMRRGRPAVWAVWGIPQAVNVGDSLMAIAHRTLLQLGRLSVSDDRLLAAVEAFDRTCVSLTEGQYLDMSFQSRMDVTVEQYLSMIDGKTAALMGLSAQVGPLVGGAPAGVTESLRQFGLALGTGFQIEDDILGIWGDEAITGKSAASDILERKKSLPIIYGLRSASGEQLRSIYQRELASSADVAAVLALLDEVDARGFSQEHADAALARAMSALAATGLSEPALAPLRELALSLSRRKG
jgi:geranylgeranyl diphosphate synthase type I